MKPPARAAHVIHFGRLFLVLFVALTISPRVLAQDAPDQPTSVFGSAILVTTLTDSAAVDGACSLREAIVAANTDTAVDSCGTGAGSDTIVLTGLTGEIVLSSALPTLTTPITLQGRGATTMTIRRLASAPAFPVLTITNANVVILGVTLSGGAGISGGGIVATGSTIDILDSAITASSASSSGGGIYSTGGSLVLTRVTVAGNSAAGSGGGVFNSGALQIITSTLSGNTAGSSGGGIYHAAGAATLRNITVSGNTASSSGGGVFSASGTLLTSGSTIAANSAGSVGGGVTRIDGTFTLRYTLIADNGANDCFGALTSQGRNLIRNVTCTVSGDTATNITGANPLLAALADNGGPTRTHALNGGSPAANPSGAIDCEPADQRGTVRPQNGTCDIGAFEVSGEPTPPPIVPVDAPLEGTVVRGLVMNRDRVPLPNVTISVLNRPDITPILTHADGSFSLRVTGTGALTINYAKTGYLVSQRHLDARHEDYAWIEDVVLVQLDARATTIDTSNPAAFQVAQGSVVTDEDGTRQATLIIPPGTNAEVRLPNGGTQLMPSLTVRATEYTVGDTGNDAMPGELPPTIGYTYAVEYSADEAIALGATSVEFDRPIFHYVENFIDMPIGTQVPMGFYDRRIGAWVGSENGRVIRVIGITNGLADVDVNGDGIADNADLGLTPGERGTIGDLYDLGDEMFRVPIRHFTPWDANFPFGPPPGAAPPNVPTPPPNPLLDNTCQQTGSIIGCENQTLSESVAVTGSPFRLVYSSDRVPGRSAAYTLDIPLSGATLPPSVQAMRVQIDIAGRQFVQDYAPAPNQTTRFTWDGLDAYGRAVTEARPLRLRVGYVYQMVYYAPGTFGIAWGRFSGTPLSARRQSLEIVLWQDSEQILTYPRLDQTTVAGWSLDAHHRYDPVEGTLYLGDGSRRSADAFIYGIITPLAGNGSSGFSGDGGAARAATLNLPSGIASAADGAIIFADYNNHRVRRIAPDGIITTIAGTGILGYNGDGIQATTAHLNGPNGVAVAPDGSIIITEALGQRVRRIAADGIITTIAGTGVAGSSGDEGLATAARVNNPNAPIAAPDGTIYFADTGNHRVRAITPDDPRTPIVDSRIIPIAGTGTAGSSGDGGLADAAQLNLPRDVAIASDGAIYIADGGNHRVRRIAPDGIITTIAGTGTAGFSGDGSAATTAQLNAPEGVAVTAEGTIAIADTANARLRFIDPSGIITTFAGTGSNGYSGTPQPAGRATLNQPNEIVIAADGAFVFADANNHTIRRIEPGLPGTSPTDILLPDSAGDVVYRFSAAGRHLTTLDELTGAVLLTFAYDGAGRLITITDADANVTTIARNGSGVPTAITAPYGQVTNLIVNAGGVLQRITDPTGAFVEMGYAAGALLTSYRDARANVSAFAYDSRGRLIRHQNAANGVTTLTRSGSGAPNALFTLTTPGTRVTTYNVTETAAAQTRVNTFPTGLATTLTRSISGTTTLLLPDGTISSYADIGDPRWGMLQPFTATETIITLGGRTRTVTETRAASLSNPLNPFSITSMSQTVALNGRNYTTSYNPNTRTFTLTTPVGRTATVILDTRGRRVSEQNTGLALTSITYDSRGRLATISEGTRVTTLAYNAAGYIASITDPLSRVTTYAYDLAGRLTQETLPGGRTIAYAYDANGNLTSFTPPGRTAHTMTYNVLDRMTAVTPPDVVAGTDATTYTYNPDRQLTGIALPDGRTIAMSYDTGARVASMTIARGAFTYGYSPTSGHLTSLTAPGGITHTFTYDGLLLLSEALSGTVVGTVSRTFDNDFRPATLSVNGANPITMTYDDDSRLTGAGALTLTYHPQHGLLTGTSIGTPPNAVVEAFTYNTFGEVTGYNAVRNAVALFNVASTYDALGRRTQRIETIGGIASTYVYSYDAAGRLSGVTKDSTAVEAYTYDLNGNRLTSTVYGASATGTYDAQDRILTYGAATFTHSADGARLTRTDGGGTTTYAYDELSNLLSVALPGGTNVVYTIDGNGRRIGRTQGADVRRYLWQDNLRIAAQLDGANAVVSRFVYADGINVPATMIRGGVTYRLLTDHLGSVRLVVDVATGTIAQRIDYDSYGVVLADSNPGFQPFGYAGGLYDSATGLVRFGARDYDARTGRWTSKDPIGFAQGETNAYEYALSDPLNNADPNGLAPLKGLKEENSDKAVDTLEIFENIKEGKPSPRSETEILTDNMGQTAAEGSWELGAKVKRLWQQCADALSGDTPTTTPPTTERAPQPPKPAPPKLKDYVEPKK